MFTKTRFIVPLILFSLLISCRSFDNKLLEQKEYFDNSVLPMKVVINNASVDEFCFRSQEITTTEVIKVLRENLLFEPDTKNIYLSVIIRKSVMDYFQHLYEVFFLMIPILIGAPMDSVTHTITLEAAIMRSDGRILKTYNSTGNDTEYIGGPGRFTRAGGFKTSKIKALQSACKDLREQLKDDAENIRNLAL